MRISLIIPTYNRAKLLPRALDSVLSQTCPVDEIIVVDDGSTDDTRRVIKEYGPVLRYFHQENAGVSVARNRGLRESRCEWIAFLDADDEWLPHKIKYQKRILQTRPDLRWCSCCAEIIEDNGKIIVVDDDVIERIVGDGETVSFFESARKLNFGTGSYVIRRSVIQEVGGFNPQMTRGEDRDLWWRIAMRYPVIGFHGRICWRIYGDTPSSLSKGDNDGQMQLSMLCRNLHLARHRGEEVVRSFYPFARKYALDYLYRHAGRQIQIDRYLVEDAKRLFRPNIGEKLLLNALNHLPRPAAEKVLNRVTM